MAKKYATAEWLNGSKLEALAKKRGCPDGDSLFDFAEEWEAVEQRRFPNAAMARGWAERNKALDMHSEPRVTEWQETKYGDDAIGSWTYCEGWQDTHADY